MCFMVLSGQTQRVLRPPHTCNDQLDVHMGEGQCGRGQARLNTSGSFVCVCVCVCACVSALRCTCISTAVCALYFRKPELNGLR